MPQFFEEASPEADDPLQTSPSGLEPELGGDLRGAAERNGCEPELGGVLRQKGVYVDELTCIGCKHCALVARNTFYIEPDYGRARAIRQDGDPDDLVQEAIDTCPVDCIEWVDYTELKKLEEERKHQVIPIAGFPVDKAMTRTEQRKRMKHSRQSRARKPSSLHKAVEEK
ncbi:MAG: ferredoxin [Cyanobacteria bacterium J06639_14]